MYQQVIFVTLAAAALAKPVERRQTINVGGSVSGIVAPIAADLRTTAQLAGQVSCTGFYQFSQQYNYFADEVRAVNTTVSFVPMFLNVAPQLQAVNTLVNLAAQDGCTDATAVFQLGSTVATQLQQASVTIGGFAPIFTAP